MDVNMVVYEVNLEFDVAIAAAYREWLRGHMADMLALPGFRSGHVHEVVDPLPTAGRVGLCVRYHLDDLGALENYQRDHAPRMRAEGLNRFGEEGVRIRRRVLRESTLD